jgi:hypothetical protein
MYNREQMKEALGKLSWKKVSELIEPVGFSDPEVLDRLIQDVVRTGCLIRKHATPEQRKARDKFRARLRALIAEKASTELLDYLDLHILECARIEEAFDAILASVEECAISKRTAQEQVWGVVERTIAEIRIIHKKLGEVVIKSAGSDGFAFINPLNVRIKDEDGNLVNPDAIVNNLIESMGSAIKMLAYGGLLDGQRIVLPPYLATSEQVQYEAIIHHLYAQIWELIEEGSEHIRFWDEELVVEEEGAGPNDPKHQRLFRFDLDLTSEVFFFTARLRLEQQSLQNNLKFKRLAQLAIGDPSKEKVSFAPNSFVSEDEADALLSLSAVYNYPIMTSTKEYGGLSFREWIRAYAVLQRCFARDKDGEPVFHLVPIDRESLKATLELASLTAEKAEAFISALTFSLDRIDVYDAPLLEDSDGQLQFFAAAYAAVSLPKVILSQFSSQEIQVYGKGEIFEAEVHRMFKEAKIPVAGFKYKLDGYQFDCDAAVLWDNQLFLFECKNFSLPTGRASDDYFFMKKLEEAEEQIRRIGEQLTENPDILRQYFGKESHWEAVHLVLLNAMPLAIAGQVDGIYYYDASALGKFLREREISILIDPSGSQGGAPERVATYCLWDGETPSASDFLRQLYDPIQLKLVQGKLAPEWNLKRLSPQLVAAVPFVKSETITPEEMLEVLGHTPESVKSVLKDLDAKRKKPDNQGA